MPVTSFNAARTRSHHRGRRADWIAVMDSAEATGDADLNVIKVRSHGPTATVACLGLRQNVASLGRRAAYRPLESGLALLK